MRAEIRPLARYLADRQRELRQELRAEAPNETIVGALTLGIERITDEIGAVAGKYQDRARAILTPEQMEALVPIEAPAAMWHTVRQAAAYNLVPIPDMDDVDSRRTPSGPSRGPRR